MVSLPKHGMFDGISGRSPIAADLARRKASLANKDWGLSSEMVDFNHKNNVHIFGVHYLVGDLEHDFYFPFHIWDVILPIDFHIFQDGSNHQPVIDYVFVDLAGRPW